MRDCNVQGAGVPDGAVYKEVVVIGTFLFKKKKMLISPAKFPGICFSVCVYIFG